MQQRSGTQEKSSRNQFSLHDTNHILKYLCSCEAQPESAIPNIKEVVHMDLSISMRPVASPSEVRL